MYYLLIIVIPFFYACVLPMPCALNEPSQHSTLYVLSLHKQPRLPPFGDVLLFSPDVSLLFPISIYLCVFRKAYTKFYFQIRVYDNLYTLY